MNTRGLVGKRLGDVLNDGTVSEAMAACVITAASYSRRRRRVMVAFKAPRGVRIQGVASSLWSGAGTAHLEERFFRRDAAGRS